MYNYAMKYLILMLLAPMSAFAVERSVTIIQHGDNSDTIHHEIWGNYADEYPIRHLLNVQIDTIEFKLDVERCRFFYIQAKSCNAVGCTGMGPVRAVRPECTQSDPAELSE